MTQSFLQSADSFVLEQRSQKKVWVNSRYDPAAGMSGSQLLFNEAFPASASNRASHVGPPAPVVIERLLPLSEVPESGDGPRSSFKFKVLSEERMQVAVTLAQRELRRRRLARASGKHPREASRGETSGVELYGDSAASSPEKTQPKASDRKTTLTVTWPSAKRHAAKKHPVSALPRVGMSPPTRDPGPRRVGGAKDGGLGQEIRGLQRELEVYISNVEALGQKATGGKREEALEDEEEARREIHRKKQAAQFARIIYVLQQQVKEVQVEIQKSSDGKQTAPLIRLAAAHRRALRALRVFNQQLSDASSCRVPSHSKDLSQLLRQLALCTAKAELDRGSGVPEMALDVLQKLEILDSALSKQELLDRMQVRTRPPRRKSPRRSVSPPAAAAAAAASRGVRGPARAAHPRGRGHGGKAASQMLRRVSRPTAKRREVLRAAVEKLSQQREPREQPAGRRPGRSPDAVKTRDSGFQRPTVSSRLRVNQLPQKESCVPWKPASPRSPPRPPPPPSRRSPERKAAEPRCLFSPERPGRRTAAAAAVGGPGSDPILSPQQKKEALNEALRTAWLERMTTQRLRELRQMSEEEEERVKRLRSDVISPTQWAEHATRETREQLRSLLDEIRTQQVAGGAEPGSEAPPEGRVEKLAQPLSLDSMLLRIEEIEKDEQEVRRRLASIAYSDPRRWDPAAESSSRTPGAGPTSPRPIRLTKAVLKQTPAADIILEAPVETGFRRESSPTEEEEEEEERQHPSSSAAFPGPTSRGDTGISVPGGMLGSIRQYREDRERCLRASASHGHALGGSDLQSVVESMADELLLEALAEVAAEFQDVAEQYAEAVFTAEFLQPAQSPPTSAVVAAAGQ
ncbi:unnamed protein product [Ophioblennius macclurei]